MRYRAGASWTRNKFIVKVDWLLQESCKYLGTTVLPLNTSSRQREFATVRAIIAAILRRHNTITDWQIGELIDRDHASAIAAIKRFNNLFDTDRSFREFASELEKKYILIFGSKTDDNSRRFSISEQIFMSGNHSMEDIVRVLIR
jgi:hypothetical protein